MIIRVGLLHMWYLPVVLGHSIDNTNINCSTRCFTVVNSTDQYCYVDCVTENSQSSSTRNNLNKSIEFKGYSGYAAVAAKLRYYKQQHDMKTEQKSKSSETSAIDRFFAVFYATLMVFGWFCAAWFGNIPGDRKWSEAEMYLYVQECEERLRNDVVGAWDWEEEQPENNDPLFLVGGPWYAQLLHRLGYLLDFCTDCIFSVFDFVVSCIE